MPTMMAPMIVPIMGGAPQYVGESKPSGHQKSGRPVVPCCLSPVPGIPPSKHVSLPHRDLGEHLGALTAITAPACAAAAIMSA
jgi:hypothetical protein